MGVGTFGAPPDIYTYLTGFMSVFILISEYQLWWTPLPFEIISNKKVLVWLRRVSGYFPIQHYVASKSLAPC